MVMDSSQAQLRHQIPSFAFNSPNNKFRREVPPPAPIITMNSSKQPVKLESITTAPQGVWTTPTSQGMRPRPATIHEGFSYCMGEGFEGVPAWDTSSFQTQQTPSDTMSSRPLSVHQDYYPATTMESNSWVQKPCDDSLELHGLDSDMNIGQAYTTDEAIPILDLRYPGQPMEGESMPFDGSSLNQRRMSGSSFTMSTSGGLSDMPSYEDFSAAMSDAPSFASDYPPPSNRNSMMSSTQLSPVASPRMTPQSRSELVRTQSRGRASPSPRPGVRAAPYSVDGPRNKRWSTGSYGTAQTRRPSPFVYHQPHDAYNAHARMSSRHSSPTIAHAQMPLNYGNLQAAQHPYMINNTPGFRNSMLLPSQLPSHNGFHPDMHHHFEPQPAMLPHGLFRMLQSNADPHSLHNHYTDLSDPPDLYAALQEEQLPPPPEDMNPSDPDMVPHEQELRFEGDWYTPKWVRGHGNKREGWCGICKPGRWLVLKNSAFWYDKSFTHGISAATGSPFNEPQETRRMDGNPDVWEGLCGSCNDWIALVSSKKKGTTWFRHAYKCHTHPKIKDAPKRRRESSHTRVMGGAGTISRQKAEPQTPQMSQAASGANTPVTSQAPPPQQPLTPLQTPQQQQQQQQQQESEGQSQKDQQQQQQQTQQPTPQHEQQPPPIPPRHQLHVYNPHQHQQYHPHIHPQLQIQVTSAPQQHQQVHVKTPSAISPMPVVQSFLNMI